MANNDDSLLRQFMIHPSRPNNPPTSNQTPYIDELLIGLRVLMKQISKWQKQQNTLCRGRRTSLARCHTWHLQKSFETDPQRQVNRKEIMMAFPSELWGRNKEPRRFLESKVKEKKSKPRGKRIRRGKKSKRASQKREVAMASSGKRRVKE